MTSSTEILEGSNEWLFLTGGSNAVLSFFSSDEQTLDGIVGDWAALLLERRNRAALLGAKYLHVVVPDKLNIYRDYLDLETPIKVFPAELLESRCNAMKIGGVFVPLTDYLRKQSSKYQLFWKTDTHWTVEGCFCAYQMICSYLGVSSRSDLLSKPRVTREMVLDLGSKCIPQRTEIATFANFGTDSKRVFANDIVLAREQGLLKNGVGFHVGSIVKYVNTNSKAADLRILVFGDSYFEYRTNALTGMMADTAKEITFAWSARIDWALVEELRPDVIITEIAERFMQSVPKDGVDLRAHATAKLAKEGLAIRNPLSLSAEPTSSPQIQPSQTARKFMNTKIACCTMVWNENFFLPMWRAHYGKQFGEENLYIIDNDSDDGSTNDLRGGSKVRYPRTPLDNKRRAAFIADFVNLLLREYDVVVFTDCDEFLVADPKFAGSLPEYFSAVDGDAYLAIGLNIFQILTDELSLDTSRPVFEQRRHAMFVSPMCKTLGTRKPISWSPGFHASSVRPALGPLYNFHLRWVDVSYALKRLELTRAMKRADDKSWHYQKMPDEELLSLFISHAKLDRRTDSDFSFASHMDVIKLEIEKHRPGALLTFSQSIRDSFFTIIPDRFSGSL